MSGPAILHRGPSEAFLTWHLLQTSLLARKRLILAVFALTTLAAIAAVYLRRPTFESSAAVLVNVERLGVSSSRADIRQDVAVLTTVEAVTSQAEVLRSRELIEHLVDRLDPRIFERPPSRIWIVAAASAAYNEVLEGASNALRMIALLPPRDRRFDLIRQIERNLDVSTVRQAQVIRLTFRAPTPEAARTVLRELLEIYQSRAAGRKLNGDEHELLLQEASRAKEELEKVENQLFALRRQYRIVDLAAEKASITERLNTLIVRAEGAQDVGRRTPPTLLPNAAPQIQAGQGGPAGESFVLTDTASGEVPTSAASAQVLQLRSQLNSLRIERAGLLSGYSADHPRIRAIERQSAAIDDLLQQEIAKLVETVNSYRGRLDLLLEIEPAITRLTRNASILSNSYEVYRKASEDRQIMRQQDARLQIQIVDEPSRPYSARGPVPAWLVLGGMAAGLVLAVAAALALTFLQLRRQDETRSVATASA